MTTTKTIEERLRETTTKVIEHLEADIIDDVMEFLRDEGCLNEKGLKLRDKFWKNYIEEDDE